MGSLLLSSSFSFFFSHKCFFLCQFLSFQYIHFYFYFLFFLRFCYFLCLILSHFLFIRLFISVGPQFYFLAITVPIPPGFTTMMPSFLSQHNFLKLKFNISLEKLNEYIYIGKRNKHKNETLCQKKKKVLIKISECIKIQEKMCFKLLSEICHFHKFNIFYIHHAYKQYFYCILIFQMWYTTTYTFQIS